MGRGPASLFLQLPKRAFHGELFNEICKENNISGINGHRSVGGYRASIYNALPIDSVKLLIKCMKEFESNYNCLRREQECLSFKFFISRQEREIDSQG